MEPKRREEKQVFAETGERSLYAVNISDSTGKVRDNAYRALEYGTNCLMVNAYTTGFDTLKMLAGRPGPSAGPPRRTWGPGTGR